jgi:hypothetical protein
VLQKWRLPTLHVEFTRAYVGQYEYTSRAVNTQTGATTWAGSFGANCRVNVVDSDVRTECGIPRQRLAALFGSSHRLCLERLAELRGIGGPQDPDFMIAYALGLLGAELRARGERRAVVAALFDMVLRLALDGISQRSLLVRARVMEGAGGRWSMAGQSRGDALTYSPLGASLQLRLIKRYVGSVAGERTQYSFWGLRPPVIPRSSSSSGAPAAAAGAAAALHQHHVSMARDVSTASFFSEGTFKAAAATAAVEGQLIDAEQSAGDEEWERVAAKVVCSQRALAALVEAGLPRPQAAATSSVGQWRAPYFGDDGGAVGGAVGSVLLDLLLLVLRGGAWQLVSGAFLDAMLYHAQVRGGG